MNTEHIFVFKNARQNSGEKKLCRDAFLKDAQLRILCHDRDAAKDASATVKNVRLSTVVCKKCSVSTIVRNIIWCIFM